MKLKKRLEFHPKKVHIGKYQKELSENHPKGDRYGKRWFPYTKSK